jgi:two-component system nitrogen regulation sensor histidine kinase NtrY
MAGPASPEKVMETSKRRRERLLIGLTLLLVVAITSLEVHLVRQGGHPVTGSLLAFGLLNVNAILFLFLCFLLFRNLSKLFLERRQKVFGSRLRTRLVLTFISLALLPTLFMFFMAWQLISSRIDYSLDPRLQESLEQTRELGRRLSQGLEGKLQACGTLFRRELAEADWSRQNSAALEALLSQKRQTYHLTALEILDGQGRRLAASYEEGVTLPPVSLPAASSPDLNLEGTFFRQHSPEGELFGSVLPLSEGAAPSRTYLVIRQLVLQPFMAQISGAERQIQESRRLHLLVKPVRVSHYLALVIVTLMAAMSALWLAFYMAREITTPIRQLAEGTLKVAGGDYDFQIDLEGKDEIGFLVQSFNKMTQDLQVSRAQLAAAYRELSLSHEELAAQKRHMEILLKNVAAGVVAIDAQGRVAALNDSAAQILHLNREEVLGQDCRVLLPPGEYNRLAEVVAEARQSRGSVERPFHLNLPDRTLYLLLKPTILKDDSGLDLGVVVVFEDLTELERLQRQAAWREVARRIAHEVKNPLTPIKLAAQRLRRRYLERLEGEGEIFDECSQIIIDQVDGLKNLANEFSRFARLPHLTLAPEDLNTLIQETLLLYLEAQPRVAIEFQPNPEVPPLFLDREQIKRALLNLLDNALASIPDTGTIALALRGEAASEWVELEVADTGSGVSDRDKARIFEPYFSTKRGGTGLGLAIVQSIVEEHQGHIRVENNVPQGTRFIIQLPAPRGGYAAHRSGSG